jgi:YggT family protein
MGALFLLLKLYGYVVLAAVIISWVPSMRDSSFGQLVLRATEPVFNPVRKVLPPMGGVDLAPLVVLIAIQLLGRLLGR